MNLKKLAAEEAIEYIKDGMVIGLGTGSTVYYALKKIGQLVSEGLEIIGIPTSLQTEKIAKNLNIPLSTLEEYPTIDVTIDGADEVDKNLNLIKGGGGALLREKIVANSSKKEIIVVDSSKIVNVLGSKCPLPVEIVPFGLKKISTDIEKLGCRVKLKTANNKPFVTDNNNYILDCFFKNIKNPKILEQKINSITGVVENGLFICLADIVIVASETGVKKLYS